MNGGLKAELKRAVFLDRDGTIIEDRDYLKRVEDVVIFPGAAAALKRLQDAGFRLFIVSNQSGVRFEKIYFAPEAPEQPSRGRKPSPQFLFDARDEFGVDLGGSYMIGDKLIDLECGWNAGVKKSLLVRTGYGAKLEKAWPEKLGQAIVADDLAGAVRRIKEVQNA